MSEARDLFTALPYGSAHSQATGVRAYFVERGVLDGPR